MCLPGKNSPKIFSFSQQTTMKHLLAPSLVALLLLSSCWFSSSEAPESTQLPPENKHTTAASIIFEEPVVPSTESKIIQIKPKATKQPAPVTDSRPKVAIIIDDMGYHYDVGDGLLELDMEITFSFLPHAPLTEKLMKKAHERGRDIMAHLPMEASDRKWDPGPGALYLAASHDALVQMLRDDLAEIPYAIGANNHMGSKFTENRQAMHTVLTEIKKQGLFFIDSFTTSQSTGMSEATRMGIKTNRRNIFLDNVQNSAQICSQIKKLVQYAQKKQQAIGIGHPYKATLTALSTCGQQLLSEVQVVPVHTLVQ